ncbi:MAG: 5'-nucleotidase C-terminal domain-containing protein, partial [Clostridiales bacterium]|nr:5'-nucleotidase C-terminal domain-containing protein [Clostridiales bacterium]
YISCADVSLNTARAEYTVKPRLISSRDYASNSIQDDPAIEDIFGKYFPTSNPYTTVLGTNTYKRWSSDICWQVAKLYYETGIEEWGSQYDIVLGGGYLKTRSPYNLEAGELTYAKLFSVLPFDNEIVLGSIKGSDLKSKFISTDNENYHVYPALSASDYSNNDTYYIIIDSYTSTYAPNRITEVARLNSGKYARDLLADFVSSGGWEVL